MEPSADVRRELVALLPRLRRFARSLTGNATDADDLVQDALEKALSRLGQWRPGTRLDSWVFRIMQTVWIDAVRARQVRQRVVQADGEADVPGVDGRTALEAHLTLARAKAVLAEMPEEQRVVVMLVMVEGFSYREAAEILGVPEGTVTSRLFRARKALEERLEALKETTP